LFDTQAGKPVVKRFTFPHTAGGLKQLVDRVDTVRSRAGGGEVTAVIEPTGKVWTPVAAYLRECGMVTLMPSPMLAAAYRKRRQKGGKSNHIDADSLARLPLAEGDRLNPACLRDQPTGDLHQWCKCHEKLTKQIAATKNRIRSEFQSVSPQMLKCFGDDAFTQLGRTFMKHYLDPHKVARSRPEHFVEVLAKKAKRSPDRVEQVALNVHACATSAVELYRVIAEGHGMPLSFAAAQDRVGLLLDQLKLYEKQVKGVEREIATLHAAIEPEGASQSLPGFGKHIGPVVDSAVGDIGRFPNGDAFAAYVRCVPRQNSTGNGTAPEGEHERQPLRKDGNRYLAKQFYLGGDVARRYDVDCARVYLRLKAKGRHHNQCVVAVGHKLALRYFALKKRQLTDPHVRYEFRDVHGRPISKKEAKAIVDQLYEEAERKQVDQDESVIEVAAEPLPQSEPAPRQGGPQPVSELIGVLAAKLGLSTEGLSAQLDEGLQAVKDGAQNPGKKPPKNT